MSRNIKAGFLLIIVLKILMTQVYAQSIANNWYFGYDTGITFSTVPPTYLPGSIMYAFEGCASLSDNNGNLLFYTDGSTIWASNHSVMPSGTGLNSSYTCSQSALFIPYPGNDSLYFLFTPPDFYVGGIFCYSMVDLTLNNGYGDITNKNTPLFTPSTEKVTAVHHANGTDIWVIGHSFDNADFYAYLITSAGINATPVISTAGAIHTGGISNKIGIMKASPCGDKIALTVFDSAFVELFDFDNTSGIVSNAINLGNYLPANTYGVYGTEFSPDGSRLYVTQGNPALLVQHNLLAGSPAAIIASADTIVSYNSPTRFGTLQIGPDGKIYIARYGEAFLAKINNPNNLGTSCNFIDTAIILNSGYATHGLPNLLSSFNSPIFCNNIPLPIKLISFKGKASDNKNILSWTTASEINNNYFTLLKSSTGKDFQPIAKIDGAGNSTQTSNYSFTDSTPFPGINYYQLQQTDYNGQNSFSKIIAVNNSSDKINPLIISPNPATDEIFISGFEFNTNDEIQIVNTLGKLVYQNKITEAGSNFKFQIANFAQGIYFIKVKHSPFGVQGAFYSQKFIKQ